MRHVWATEDRFLENASITLASYDHVGAILGDALVETPFWGRRTPIIGERLR